MLNVFVYGWPTGNFHVQYASIMELMLNLPFFVKVANNIKVISVNKWYKYFCKNKVGLFVHTAKRLNRI